jgi:putative ABC transport system permease protein
MTWQFYGATIDPEKKTRDNIIFFFSMEPMKMTKMMDGMEEYSASQLDQLNKLCEEMVKDKRKIIVGTERLQAINKKVGERIKLTSFNYKGIDLEVEIIGSFPEGRYNQSAILNRDYLNDSLDDYNRKNPNSKHPMSNRNLNLVWIRVPDKDVFQKVERQITDSPSFTSPAVKVETASSGISTFLDAYRDLLWGLRWILAPFILATMALIIAVAISISVRERRKEIAVMKVIGFTPIQILCLVLGEAIMVGGFSGLVSSIATTMVINNVFGGIKFPIAFFPIFMIPIDAIWWGPAIGISTALGGSLLPSLSACRVKVSEVFARTS